MVPDTDIETYEQEDDYQIVHASKELIQALVYVNKQGNKELSYTGIQWIAQRMAENGQSLEAIFADTKLVKHDPDDKSQWIWYSTAKVKNAGTGAVTIGVSESPFLKYRFDKETGQYVCTDYDEFGRTKAHGKAMRNAMRQIIPVIEIDNMIKDCTEQQVKHIGDDASSSSTIPSTDSSTTAGNVSTDDTCTPENTGVQNNDRLQTNIKSQSDASTSNTSDQKPVNTHSNCTSPTVRQIKYLKVLGYTGDMPLNVSKASELIQDLKEKKRKR